MLKICKNPKCKYGKYQEVRTNKWLCGCGWTLFNSVEITKTGEL